MKVARLEKRELKRDKKIERREQKARDKAARRPLDRRTVMIVILSAVAVTLYSVAVPVHVALYASPVPVMMLLAAVAVAAALVGVKYPNLAIIMFTVAAVLIPLTISRDAAVQAPWPWSVPMLITFAVTVAALTFQHGWRHGLIMLGSGTASGLVASIMLPTVPSANSLIVTTSVVGGIYLIAVLLAGRLRLGDELTRQRAHTAEEQARRELVEERTRIARELHDVVAHSMSVIQVQASTARYRLPDLPADVATEFDDLAATARSSLTEMRRLLGVLRTEDQSAELTPQQGIGDIPALVDSIRRAGVDVGLELVTADVTAAPGSVQIAAFRIVQEALSNAVRHAPGSRVSVSVRTDDTTIHLRVHNSTATDEAAGSSGAAQSAGHGLRGMRERVALVDGTLEAGPGADGGWTVAAVLPWVSKQESM
ncbi:sensor histidine kinase [Microbacterium profundi]|uniref:sensor histidine kinase n=1 Tax=Microbacterium profundi TaxID=450380 RepID=UPI001F22CD2D|nr:sensor histidine kinase [Microbacterium profundi]MCE7482389.1 sensor histidine kinase [Microbacterium profundi]